MSAPQDAQAGTRSTRIVWILVGAVTLCSLVFAFVTIRSRKAFDTYKEQTLSNASAPPRWDQEALSVEGCVDEVLAWGLECPSIQSWCLGSVPGVLHTCLRTQDRTDACASYGDGISATRFGYEACAERYKDIGEKYKKRATKKYCATIYRSVADFCANGAG